MTQEVQIRFVLPGDLMLQKFIKDNKDILSHIFWITETFRFLCESCHLCAEMLALSTKLFFIAAEPLVMGIGRTSTTMLSLCSPFWDMAQEISPAQAHYETAKKPRALP